MATNSVTGSVQRLQQHQRRQSREQQRNRKIEAAYRSIRDLGSSSRHPALEAFTVASGSVAGVRYTVSHDMMSDRLHCDCPAGIHGHGCVHQQAVTRTLEERRASWHELQQSGYNDTYNLHYGTQAASAWD